MQPIIVQPLLWHDIQVFVHGPATRTLYLHFAQRWLHAFTREQHKVRELKLPPIKEDEVRTIYCSIHL